MSDFFIDVNYEHMQQASQTLRQLASTMEDKLAKLRNQLSQITWKGDAQVAYRQHQDEWDKAVAELNRMLDEHGIRVNAAQQAYRDTELRVKNSWA